MVDNMSSAYAYDVVLRTLFTALFRLTYSDNKTRALLINGRKDNCLTDRCSTLAVRVIVISKMEHVVYSVVVDEMYRSHACRFQLELTSYYSQNSLKNDEYDGRGNRSNF